MAHGYGEAQALWRTLYAAAGVRGVRGPGAEERVCALAQLVGDEVIQCQMVVFAALFSFVAVGCEAVRGGRREGGGEQRSYMLLLIVRVRCVCWRRLSDAAKGQGANSELSL